jgi:hypothetical protein
VALSPPYRATPPAEDVSGFDGGVATPPRAYLLAGRLFAGGLSGSALILLAISSFAVGIGVLSLLPHDAAPARAVQVLPPKRASAVTPAAARTIPKLTAEGSLSRARAHGHQPSGQVAQDATTSRPVAPADKAPSTLATPGNATSPVESPVAASTQVPPAADPVAIEPSTSDVVDTLVSTIPALPAVSALPAVPALPAPVASVVTTATTLVGTP